jgi:glycogen debranching enzyme
MAVTTDLVLNIPAAFGLITEGTILPYDAESPDPEEWRPPYDPKIRSVRGDIKVHEINAYPFQPPRERLTPTQGMLRLTGAKRLEDVGAFGPVVASGTVTADAVSERRLFEVLFGRDALIVAKFAKRPRLTEATVLRLAEDQGLPRSQAPDPDKYEARHEEPGRIIHELRDPATDERARELIADLGWSFPLYASDDATLLFIQAVLQMAEADPRALKIRVRQRDGIKRSLAECLGAAFEWIDSRIGQSHLFVTHYNGWFFEGWADSGDSIHHADGRIPENDVALVEIQALVYDSHVDAAQVFKKHAEALAETLNDLPEKMKELLHPARLEKVASDLKEATLREFRVDDDRGTFLAAGVEHLPNGGLDPLAVRRSSMGHPLDSNMLQGSDLVPLLVEQLMDPDKGMLAYAGIRTLDRRGVRFREGAYHNGTVWLWEQLKIADGLDRHGLHGLAWQLKARLVNTVHELGTFPEFVRGGDELQINQRTVQIYTVGPDGGPMVRQIEQVPQDLQAWTVAAMLEIERQLKLLVAGSPDAPLLRAVSKDAQELENKVLAKLAERGVLLSISPEKLLQALEVSRPPDTSVDVGR